MKLKTLITLAVVALLIAPIMALAKQPQGVAGAVYTITNAAGGNQVLAYDRLANGSLEFLDAYPTEGLGSGDGLGNQGGVVLSDNGRWLLVVNAGSDEISVFSVDRDGLTLTDVTPSGGCGQ